MIFSRFFRKKGYRDYESRGDGYLQQERFADARIEYEAALERLGEEADAGDPDALKRIGGKLAATGLGLARLNLDEARTAFASGNRERGEEFLELAGRFSESPEIRRQIAEIMRTSPSHAAPSPSTASPHRSRQGEGAKIEPIDSSNDTIPLPEEEVRFELYISTLPGNLPDRYRSKGKDFAKACILAHDGQRREAFAILQRLAGEEPCDLILYEMALIAAQEGDPSSTERFLRQSLELDADNPLSGLSLAQLLMVQRRHDEARGVLDSLRSKGGLGNQVLLLLGDNAQGAGNIQEAESFYLEALKDTSLARAAAERLVPIMESTGRLRERDFLLKKHCGKGCC